MQIKTLLSAAIAVASVAAQNDSSTSLTSVLTGNQDLSALVALLQQFPDVLDTLTSASNITILAPSNDAIDLFNSSGALADAQQVDGLIPATLQYHVLSGMIMSDNISDTATFAPSLLTDDDFTSLEDGQVVEAVTADSDVVFYGGLRSNATVSEADIEFDGGIIHIVDNVLQVPQNVTAVATAANLTSLVGALTTADLVETLVDLDQVTIFAPNNAAFQAIGSAVETLSTEQLAGILQYHVVSGSVLYSSDLSNTTVEALDGTEITVTVSDEGVFVNNAQVILADVLISSGVVHVIDQVLNPNNTGSAANSTMTMSGSASMSMSGSASMAATTADNAFSASSGTEEPFTSGVETPTTVAPGLAETSVVVVTPGDGEESDSEAAAAPMMTAGLGAAALFGGAAWMANF